MSDLENTVIRELIERQANTILLDVELPFIFNKRSPQSLTNAEIFCCLYKLEWESEFDDDELELVIGKSSDGEKMVSIREEGVWVYSENGGRGGGFVEIFEIHDWGVRCFVLVKDRLSRVAIFDSFMDAGFIKVTG